MNGQGSHLRWRFSVSEPSGAAVVMDTRFHAKAIWRPQANALDTVEVIVYSVGDGPRAFELHLSTASDPVRGGRGQIISFWQSENGRLKAAGFLLERVDVPDSDFEL
jgi:hypothetical protein